MPANDITFDNCTFDGLGTTNRAIIGNFDSIALESCTFTGYDGARVVDITSTCEVFIAENNLFEGAMGSAIFVSELDMGIIRNNVFDACGGRIR